MNATRKSLALITGIVAAVGLAACSSGPSTSGGSTYRFEDTGTFNSASPNAPSIDGSKLSTLGPAPKLGPNVKVGILVKSLTNQYWQQVEAGLNQAKSDLGVQTSQVASAQSETNTQEQLQICQTMLLQGYNAFIISPETTSNLNPCIEQMKAQNIPVINIVGPGAGLASTVYVGSALTDDGKRAGEYLAKALPAGAKVAEIQGLPGSSAADLRVTGFKSAMDASQLDLVASVPGNWDEQTAFQRTQDLLGKYPDLAGIYAANDTMAVAVAKAAQQAGRKDLKVVGTDGVPIAVDDIRGGQMSATVTPFPYYQGYWALEAAVRLLGGQNVPLWVNTPDVIVTRDTVGQYFDDQGVAKPGIFKAG
jgi:ABC-type sugar transport system substrate-binding protein